jgi:unsaturated rhamnogalacturonyl hydrolase
MKNYFLLFFTFLITQFVFAQNFPLKADLLKKMKLANNYTTKKLKIKPENDFNTALYFDGLTALNQQINDPKISIFANEWAKQKRYQLPNNEDVFLAEDLTIGSLYFDIFKKDTTKVLIINALKIRLDSLANSYVLDRWSRLEAVYAFLPTMAKMAVYTNDERYHDKMFQVFMYIKNIEGLYSDQEFLWYRDASFKPPFKTPNNQSCFWSRGNGFLAAGLAKTLSILPKDAPHYSEYLDSYLEMMIACMNLQREDGFWNISLTDPNHFGGKELTGTALITYAMAWGLANNVIDKTTFTPIVTKAINGMLAESINKNGFLSWSQGQAIEPKDNQPLTKEKVPNNEYLGLGCFLLAGAEVAKIIDK